MGENICNIYTQQEEVDMQNKQLLKINKKKKQKNKKIDTGYEAGILRRRTMC